MPSDEHSLPGLEEIKNHYAQSEDSADLLEQVADQARQIRELDRSAADAENLSNDFLASLLDTSPELWSAAIQKVMAQLERHGRGAATARKLALLEKMAAEIPGILVASRKNELMSEGRTKKESKHELKEEFQRKFAEEIIKRVSAEIMSGAETMAHVALDNVIRKHVAVLMQTIGVRAGEVAFFDDLLDPDTSRGAHLHRVMHSSLAFRQVENYFSPKTGEKTATPPRPELQSAAYQQYIRAELAAFEEHLATTVGNVASLYDALLAVLLNSPNQLKRAEPLSNEAIIQSSARMLADIIQGKVNLDDYENHINNLNPARREMMFHAVLTAYSSLSVENSRPVAEALLLLHEDELAGQGEILAKIKAQLEVGGSAELRAKLEAGRLAEATDRLHHKLERVSFLHQNDGAQFDFRQVESVLNGESLNLAVNLARQEIATAVISQKVADLMAEKPRLYTREVVNSYATQLDSFKARRFDREDKVDAAGELAFLTKFTHFLLMQDAQFNQESDRQIQAFFQQAEKLGIDPAHLVDIHNEIAMAIGKYNQRFAAIAPEQFGQKGRPAIQFRDRLSSLLINQQMADKLWQFTVREDIRGVQMQRIGFTQFDGTGLYTWGSDIKGSTRAASFTEKGVNELTASRVEKSGTLAVAETGVQVEAVHKQLTLGERTIDFANYERTWGELPNDPFVKELEASALAPLKLNLDGMGQIGERLKAAKFFGQDVLQEVNDWDSDPSVRKKNGLFDNPKGRLEQKMRETVAEGGLDRRYSLDNTKEHQWNSAVSQEFKKDLEEIRKTKQIELARQFTTQTEEIARRVKDQGKILDELMAHDGVLTQVSEGKLKLPSRDRPGEYVAVDVLQILGGYGENQALKNLYTQFSQSVRMYGEVILKAFDDKRRAFLDYGIATEASNMAYSARSKLTEALGYGTDQSPRVQAKLLTERLQPAFETAKKQQVANLPLEKISLKAETAVPGHSAVELQSVLATKVENLKSRQAVLA